MNRNLIVSLLAGALIVAGCNIHSKHEDGEGHDKNVKIDTPLGGLNVRTDNVEAKDTGLSVYPGAVAKERTDRDHDEKKANVNIDTPWFGLKVVALTYQSGDSQEKVWDYYKKELAKYGRVLECKPGSPDMDAQSNDKDELTCREDKKNNFKYDSKGMSLKVGTQKKQRIVAIKPDGSGTEFSLVYVVTREGKETL